MTKAGDFRDVFALLGRIIFSSVFIVPGLDKLINFSANLSYEPFNNPLTAKIVLIIGIILELGGGLMILFGWKTRLGAVFVFIFTLIVTYTFHSFWTSEIIVQGQMYHFFKCIAIMGGALYIIAFGPGVYSFDCCKSCRKQT